MITGTIEDALSFGNDKLKNITNNYINETFWILSKCLNQDKSKLVLNKKNTIDSYKFIFFINLINRRLNNEPLQIILESVSFYNYKFITKKDVFIVRPETELCIDILKSYKRNFDSVLEVGCGLGCISITLSLEKLSNNILAIDINSKAIVASQLNAKNLNCNNIIFMHNNIFKMKHNKKYDLIISNPPYISITEIKNLDTNVILYDPLLSLTDFNDGLNFYKHFAKIGHQILANNGLFFFEFGGYEQQDSLKNIFSSKNYKLRFFNDFNNIPRFLAVELCN